MAPMMRLCCSILISLVLAGCAARAWPTHQLEWRSIPDNGPTSQPATALNPELEP